MKGIVGLCAAVLVACGLTGAATATRQVDKPPIVIGMPIALSGPINFFDGPQLMGAQIAVEQINARGGLLGGRRLKIVTADTKSDIAQSTNAALDVIRKGARFVIPTLDYDFGGPAARIAQQRGLIAISGAGDPRFGVKGIGSHVFNVFAAGPVEGAVAATFAYKTRNWRRAFVLTDTSLNYSKSFGQYFTTSWKGQGGEIVGEDTFVNSDPSIGTQIADIKRSKAQFIFLSSYPPGGVSAIKQVRGAGISLPIVTGVPFDGTFFLAGLPGIEDLYVVGAGITTGGDPNPARRAFFRAYYLANGNKPAPLALQSLIGYSSVQAIATGIERAGSSSIPRVLAQMNKFKKVPLAIGSTTWTPSCHISPYSMVVKSFGNGREVFVAQPRPAAIPPAIC
jgi:branched-chain amino acid transport system substrate-binding protein